MIELVDTHCHIQEASVQTDGNAFVRDKWASGGFTDPKPLVEEAKKAGVTRLICVGTTVGDSEAAVALAQREGGCWASIGIHPHEAKDHMDATIQQQFAHLATEKKVVAIGECGLDYFYSHSSPTDQKEMLKFQLDVAVQHNLPVIFHVREAFDDFWPIFESYNGKIRGVLHSFTDSLENLQRAIKHGLYIGVNGIATFEKGVEKGVRYVTIPQQSLLLETDAPFLTPAPYRGTICQPKHVRVTAEYLAGVRGEKLEQLAKVTTQNACNLFGIK